MPAQVIDGDSKLVTWSPSREWYSGVLLRPRPLMDVALKFDAVPQVVGSAEGGSLSIGIDIPREHYVFVAIDMRRATPIERQAIAVLRGEDVDLETTLE